MEDDDLHRPDTISHRKLDRHQLEVVSALGRGAKGVVFLVRTRGSNNLYALKTISKGKTGSSEKRIGFEQRALSSFNHLLLPKLCAVVESDTMIGYMIDYCSGGDLHSLKMKQIEKMFSDDVIRFYAAELVLALEYLHGLGFVYRDLKPDNVMIQDNGHLMLVDFDLSTELASNPAEIRLIEDAGMRRKEKKKRKKWLSRWWNSHVSPCESASCRVEPARDSMEKSKSFVGTEDYVAPEVIEGHGHDFAVDWWSLGVVLYEMLYGATPFRGASKKETFYRILVKSPDLVGETTSLRDLIRRLLEKDPSKRIGLREIKTHEFFRGVDWDVVLNISRPPFIPTETPLDETFQGDAELEGF